MTASLPRRALLGIELPDADAEAFGPDGLHVAAVVAGGMAARAGVRAGDVVVTLADAPLRTPAELAVALRRAGGEQEVPLVLERGTVRSTLVAAVERCPAEASASAAVLYDHVESEGERLRTIVTRPHARGRHPAVLFVQGLSCATIDFASAPHAPTCQLIHGWAAHGLLSMRVEKRGVGDSEGAEAEQVDFDTEVAGVRAALRALAARDDVDPDCIFVFGHSVGGRIAPLLASEVKLRGLLTYGAPVTTRWIDVLATTTREQLALRGVDVLDIERRVTRERRILRARNGRALLDGRTVAYHLQHDAHDIAAAWRAVRAPVLTIIGELDWVVNEAEQRAIAALVDGAEVLALDGLDHAFTTHPDLAHSLDALGSGTFDGRLVSVTSAWVRRVARANESR